MTQVKIKTMQLSYFKGVRSMQLDFQGKDATVTGPNGSGKSTIMDAFTWLLWGKNAAGDSDTKFLIKTADEDGNEIPHVNHEVTAVLDIDGQETTLKRSLVPDYDKDDKLKGNHTEYTYNDVPLKKGEYDEKVKSIIDEDVFKLITSPYAFLSLDWKKQREMLMNMAGDGITDESVAAGSERFVELLGKLTGKTLEEYKRELDSKIKTVNEAMLGIPARIDEQQRSMPEDINIQALEAQEAEVLGRRSELLASKQGNEAAINAQNQARIDLAKQIADLKFELQQGINDEEAKIRNSIHQENVKYDRAHDELDDLQRKNRETIDKGSKDVKEIESKIAYIKGSMDDLEKAIADLREDWKKENAKQFQADTELICPVFKTACHDCDACAKYDSNQEQAYETFIQSKRERLETIQKHGNLYKVELEHRHKNLDNAQTELEHAKATYQERYSINDDRIAELQDYLAKHPRKPLIAMVDYSQHPGLLKLHNDIEAKEAQLATMAEAKPDQTIADLLNGADEEIAAIHAQKALAQQASTIQARIKELEAQLKDLGKQKAQLEMEKETAVSFEIAKMTEISKKVNNLFHIVTWQLFETQVNGEQVPTCKALINGVRWTDANTAARINAGIDVASTLAQTYSASAPMFIDNAECSGYIYNPGTAQRILLEFDKKAKELKVTNA